MLHVCLPISKAWPRFTSSLSGFLSPKLSCFSVNDTSPEYLSQLLTIYIPSHQLHSTSDTRLFRIPSFKTKTNGQRSFSYQTPTLWKNLPQTVRYSTSFKSHLQTHLFDEQIKFILYCFLQSSKQLLPKVPWAVSNFLTKWVQSDHVTWLHLVNGNCL